MNQSPENTAASTCSTPTAENPAPRYRQSGVWARLRLPLTILAMLILPLIAWKFALASWLEWSFPLGVLVTLLGVALRLWAAGWLHKHHSLATSGPYGLVRHPLYTGTGLSAIGQSLMSGVPLAILLLPLLWLLLYRQAIREEEQFLIVKYGDDYRQFQREVPALVPNPGRGWPAKAEKNFTWAQAWLNREYEGVFVNVLIIAVYVWLYWRQWLYGR